MFPSTVYGTASADTGLHTITGYRIAETSNVLGAKVTFRNAASGTILWTVTLNPGESVSEQFGENPISNGSMISSYYLSIDSGTVQFAVFGQ